MTEYNQQTSRFIVQNLIRNKFLSFAICCCYIAILKTSPWSVECVCVVCVVYICVCDSPHSCAKCCGCSVSNDCVWSVRFSHLCVVFIQYNVISTYSYLPGRQKWEILWSIIINDLHGIFVWRFIYLCASLYSSTIATWYSIFYCTCEWMYLICLLCFVIVRECGRVLKINWMWNKMWEENERMRAWMQTLATQRIQKIAMEFWMALIYICFFNVVVRWMCEINGCFIRGGVQPNQIDLGYWFIYFTNRYRQTNIVCVYAVHCNNCKTAQLHASRPRDSRGHKSCAL